MRMKNTRLKTNVSMPGEQRMSCNISVAEALIFTWLSCATRFVVYTFIRPYVSIIAFLIHPIDARCPAVLR